MAKTTKPIEPNTPPIDDGQLRRLGYDGIEDDDDEDFDLHAPKMSVALNDLDDGVDAHEAPPRLSSNFRNDEDEDEDASDNMTMRSVEEGRGAVQGPSRMSRGSLLSMRASDQFADIDEASTVSDDGIDPMMLANDQSDYHEGGSFGALLLK